MYTSNDLEWMDWFGSVLVRDREGSQDLDQLGLLENDFRAPWHAETYLIGERIRIDMSRVGGPIVYCEITNRRPNGNRLDLSVAPADVPREYPLA